MKKFVIAAAVLYCFTSFGVEDHRTSVDKLNEYICEWSAKFTAPISAERIERMGY
jgi:hypothetical protein